MSRLEELLQTLCPDGVEFKPLAELAEIGTGNSNRADASDDGRYPFFVRSKQVMRSKKYEFDEEAIIIPGEGGIGDIFHYINGKYDLHQRAYRISFRDSRVNTRFAYYFMMSGFKTFITMRAVTATVISIRMPMIASFLLPLPPLPVQEEIVRILDTFSSTVAELEAERAARIRQYEHYRDELLTFESKSKIMEKLLANLCPDGVEYDDLGALVDILDSQRRPVTKSKRKPGPYPYYGANGIQDYVAEFIFDGTFLLLGEDGSVINPDGSPVLTWASGKLWVNNHAHILAEKTSGALLRYLYYYLQTVDVSKVVRGVPPKINQENLRNIKIAVPPLPVQERIISILDHFEAMVNDLKNGLPAEIALRRKQYEHYRDTLLTFTQTN